MKCLPLRMAALPDLMAKLAMLAMTSGRASNMMRRTPMGHETRSRLRLSSSLVRSETLPTSGDDDCISKLSDFQAFS